jgi:hypothetical protein
VKKIRGGTFLDDPPYLLLFLSTAPTISSFFTVFHPARLAILTACLAIISPYSSKTFTNATRASSLTCSTPAFLNIRVTGAKRYGGAPLIHLTYRHILEVRCLIDTLPDRSGYRASLTTRRIDLLMRSGRITSGS